MEILARSSISPKFQANVDFKSDCLSIGVTLNFTFEKGEGLLIISGHTFFNFVVFISSHNSIAMHFVLVELSCNSLLSIDDPSKRGDVEILARSSVFPLP